MYSVLSLFVIMIQKIIKYSLLVVFLFQVLSCKKEASPVTLFQSMDSTGIVFYNNVEDAKLDNSFLFRNFYNGGGVGIADINNDGLADVFLTSNASHNKLYLNKGNFKFEDISKKAGILEDDKWNTGVVFADVNADGWLDIYVCSSGHMSTGNRKSKLYINNKNLTFTESAAAYGLDISAYTTQVSFFDYDMDGDLDCFMINNSPIPVNQLGYANRRDLPEKDWKVADFLKGGGDHLYRNDNGHFYEVSKEAGIHGSLISFGLGVSVSDINGDGYPDVFVSNDSYERDYLYINQKNGTFKDELEDWMSHISFSSMGADIADINNDGYPELFTTDMFPMNDYRLKTMGSFDNIDLFQGKLKAGFYYQYMKNCLQLNNQDGHFSEISNFSGVSATDWSWGALMFDMDNDGWNDIFVCNGVNRDVTNLDFMDFFADEAYHKMVLRGKKNELDQILKEIPRTPVLNKVYQNGKNLKFNDIGESWGFTQPTFSNGAAYADLDNDGDLDLIVSNENQLSLIYKNNAREINKNNYLGISLQGTGQNTFAIGSEINLYIGNQILTREIVPSRGFQSSVDYKAIFGLGNVANIDSLLITWPNRSYSKIYHPGVNQVLTIKQADNKNSIDEWKKPILSTTFSKEKVQPFQKHIEDNHIDFYTERNIPSMLSREGPRAAVADVNDDGLEDVYIGGAMGQEGMLYLQTNTGFVAKPQPSFKQYADFEDVASLFFDCDGDGDQDLFVGAGGNEPTERARELQHRLYINDGKGNFSIDAAAFPANQDNVSTAVAYDFDGDNDADIFVGARNVPQQYGASPTSHIYVNDGSGHFTDMDAAKTGGISAVGMVTNAIWADVAGDQKEELVIVGEWMYPHIYAYNGESFTEVKNNLSRMFGWWQSVEAADVNADGKTDLILGNIGENFYLRPDSLHPVKLWVNDFDQNNIMDKVLTSTINGKDLPVFLRQALQEQIPSVKKQNLRHAAYAEKSIQDLFGPELIKKSLQKTFNYASSCIAINNGNGNFTVRKMPTRMQLSSVNAMVCADINNDKAVDIIAGGNLSCFLPQFERLDASTGDLLINDGRGNFTWEGSNQSGIMQRGDVKDIKWVQNKNGKYLLVVQNDNYPVLYKVNDKAVKK